MLKGCLAVFGAVAVIVIGVVVYFAVRGVNDVNHATVDQAALASIRVGDTRSHVDQVLGKDGSDDTTVFASGHKLPAGTTCRYFIVKAQQNFKHVPVHRLCFSNATNRLTSIVVYPES
jgi:hypothetical protein